ncbi:MAG: hypothetical protein NPIRA06_19170 [Nitrospirales bacterium]|nr:MAG: hypothetical protein NPIRA06_19170 [Nitrospirales bacterium]
MSHSPHLRDGLKTSNKLVVIIGRHLKNDPYMSGCHDLSRYPPLNHEKPIFKTYCFITWSSYPEGSASLELISLKNFDNALDIRLLAFPYLV